MASPLYPLLEADVDTVWKRINAFQLTPWAFFNSGDFQGVHDHLGREIRPSGIKFDGSIRTIYWSGYIEPFLIEAIDVVISKTRERLSASQANRLEVYDEAAGLLKSLVRKTYARMADIDRRLRGEGFPDSVPAYNPDSHVAIIDAEIDKRIAAEPGMHMPTWKFVE